MPEEKKYRPLTSSDVCSAYKILYESGYVSFPITEEAEHTVERLVANINSSYFGREIYNSPEEKAVAYLYFLINDHPFTDGNKRTAVLAFVTICTLNSLEPKFEDFGIDQLALYIERVGGDHQKLIKTIAGLLFSS